MANKKPSKSPNFLIIGAAKAGTTSLHRYLRQHPEIFMPNLKEPKFFALEGKKLDFKGPAQGINYNSVTRFDDYLNLFSEVRFEKAIGEASPIYLSDSRAPHNIKKYFPNIKLISILRNPADRAFSSYCHLLRENYEDLSFEEGLKNENFRIDNRWSLLYHYTKEGYYSIYLKRYLDLFDISQIKIILYEDFSRDPRTVLSEIFNFLGVDSSFVVPDLKISNASGTTRFPWIRNLFQRENVIKDSLKKFLPKRLRMTVRETVLSANLGPKPKLNTETRKLLINTFRSDILSLEKMIGKDLSFWLKS
jgi:hypothetical protein